MSISQPAQELASGPGITRRAGKVSGGEASLTRVVCTTRGQVRGLKVVSDGYPTYETYFGVPYGQDTGGANRWLPPKPADWCGVLDASDFGPIAPQSVASIGAVGGAHLMSEDCLRLNIWTPKADNKKRAVLVFIHGGGWTEGDPNAAWFSGKRLAQKGIVFVDLAYRLGPWGFLDLRSLPDAPSEYMASANLGLLDQRLALKFIHDNIAKFGGDPDRVTLSGQSAGSRSATIHLALPESNRYLQRCIAMSGTPNCGDAVWGAKVAKMFMNAAGVTSFDRLMSLTVQQMTCAHEAMCRQFDPNWGAVLWRPIVDGLTIQRDPRLSIREGAGKDIALVCGSTADEVTYWLQWANWGSRYGPREASITAVCEDVGEHAALDEMWPEGWAYVYERMIANAVAVSGRTADEVERAVLAAHPGASAFEAWLILLNDLTYHIPVERLVEDRLSAPDSQDNTYVYSFDWKSRTYYSNGRYRDDDPRAYPAGAYHAADVGFAFGIPEEWTYGPRHEHPPGEAGHDPGSGCGVGYPEMTWPAQLVSQLHESWVQFVKSGDPNNPAIPKWPAYTLSRRASMHFDATPTVQLDCFATERDLWKSVPGDPVFDCPTDVAIPLPTQPTENRGRGGAPVSDAGDDGRLRRAAGESSQRAIGQRSLSGDGS